MNNIALYIHIPFCNSKCDYCDFFSFKPNGRQQKLEFEKALIEEINLKREVLKDRLVTSIYIGGGTPSVMNCLFFVNVINKLKSFCQLSKDLEFTVEVNPGSVNESLLKTFKEVGVNRISVGFQCYNDRLLKYVHRNQTFEQFREAMVLIKKYFSNVSVDLMSGLPYEKLSDIKASIKKVLKFKPSHISVYSLMVMEGTPLFNNKHILSFIPDEKLQVKMLNLANKMLTHAGFERYEVSNYAKKCKEDGKKHISKYNRFISKHNTIYWIGGDYLGFGPSAASKIGNVRLTNEKNFSNYVNQNFNVERESLTDEQIRLEKIMLGLRCKWGCEKALCKTENLPFLIKNKYIKEKGDRIVATKKGLNVLNIIIDKLT